MFGLWYMFIFRYVLSLDWVLCTKRTGPNLDPFCKHNSHLLNFATVDIVSFDTKYHPG